MGFISKTVFLFFNIIKENKIAFISSPSQLICLNEFLYKNSTPKLLIIVGYPSITSISQIKSISKRLEYIKNQKLIFLSELMSEVKFTTVLKFLKIVFFFKSVIIGDMNYYHSKGIYLVSKEVLFLDEGINFLNLKKNELKIKQSFFTIFSGINTKQNIQKNNYDYLRSKVKSLKINHNLIYLLGTSDAHPKIDALNNKTYITLIRNICDLNKNKKVIFIPHRNEVIENIKNLNIENLSIKINEYPIEFCLTQLNEIPSKFIGFYTMALINLKIVLKNSQIEVLNMNYDFKNLKNENLKDLYRIYQKNFTKFEIKELNF